MRPAPSASRGLTAFDVHASATQAPEGPARAGEELVGLVLGGGAMCEGGGGGGEAVVWRNERKNWTSLAYDEEMGRVLLGDALGRVTVLEI